MDSHTSCLNCRNYRPDAPNGWEPPDYDPAQTFDIDVLRRHLGPWPEWRTGWPGKCQLQPAPVDVRSEYLCGQWVVHDKFLRTWNEINMVLRLSAANAELEAELKKARALALERYHKLQEMKSKSTQNARQKTPTTAAASVQ
jgi:hypothetical protein